MNAHALTAYHGRLWLSQGFALLQRQPLALISLVFFYFAVIVVLGLIPVLGTLLTTLLLPGLSVGFLRACQHVEQQQRVTPKVFLDAFFNRAGKTAKPLLLLGVLYLLGWLCTVGLSVFFDGGKLFSVLLLGRTAAADDWQDTELLWSALAVMTGYLPLQILFWFAPVLVAWHDITPLKAIFFSAVAVARNMSAFLWFGALFLMFSMSGALVLALITTLLGKSAQLFFLYLFGAALMALINCSTYVSYLHIFRPPRDATTDTVLIHDATDESS